MKATYDNLPSEIDKRLREILLESRKNIEFTPANERWVQLAWNGLYTDLVGFVWILLKRAEYDQKDQL